MNKELDKVRKEHETKLDLENSEKQGWECKEHDYECREREQEEREKRVIQVLMKQGKSSHRNVWKEETL